MFRPMRRSKQALPDSETIAILNTSKSGVLAVSGDDGYPYAVPVSHVYHDGRLYFHGALEGHKVDSLRHNEKVSFCVIAQDDVIPEKFATDYRSAIVFGRARILEADDEKRRALELLAAKFSPGLEAEGQREIDKLLEKTCVIEITIEHMSGKSATND